MWGSLMGWPRWTRWGHPRTGDASVAGMTWKWRCRKGTIPPTKGGTWHHFPPSHTHATANTATVAAGAGAGSPISWTSPLLPAAYHLLPVVVPITNLSPVQGLSKFCTISVWRGCRSHLFVVFRLIPRCGASSQGSASAASLVENKVLVFAGNR